MPFPLALHHFVFNVPSILLLMLLESSVKGEQRKEEETPRVQDH